MEAAILALVAVIGGCFLVQIILARPDPVGMLSGLKPTMPPGALFVAIGILGATVMPHNLYLHSALVQSRRIGSDRASKKQACKYNLIDSAVALNAAFFVNAAILVLSAAVFHRSGQEVATIEQAYELLPQFLGSAAPILFGVALLAAGQSSTLTGTLAGQIVMEGYLNLRIAPWLRRLATRSLALVPAVIVLAIAGEGSTQELLVLSQVILSLQLSFAVIPLIHFTSNRRNMGEFATPVWAQGLAWIVAAIIVGLNGKLVFDSAAEWVDLARDSGISWVGVPLSWYVIAALGVLIGGVLALLAHVTLKPIVRPAPPWKPTPSLAFDWNDALRPRPLQSIGVALEHTGGDTEIMNPALSLATPGQTDLTLLHVVDTPLSGVHGAQTADLHAEADERYLEDLAAVLRDRGYHVTVNMLFGPDRAGRLVAQLRRTPVDLLVVGSHGHGLLRDLLFGQTVDKVRHNLEIPMLIARPEKSGGAGEQGGGNSRVEEPAKMP